jgi:hypothetical protein
MGAPSTKGRRFGTVVVIEAANVKRRCGSRLWLVRCDCGHEFSQTTLIVKKAGGACPTCSPYTPSKTRNADFKSGLALESVGLGSLARMAQKGSNACMVEFVRRGWRGKENGNG